MAKIKKSEKKCEKRNGIKVCKCSKKSLEGQRRRSFSLQYKLAALKHLDSSKNVCDTAKLFNIHNDSLRNWRKSKEVLEKAFYKSELMTQIKLYSF